MVLEEYQHMSFNVFYFIQAMLVRVYVQTALGLLKVEEHYLTLCCSQ